MAEESPVRPLTVEELQNRAMLGNLEALSIPAIIQNRTRELYSPAKDDAGKKIIGDDGEPISLDDKLNSERFAPIGDFFGDRARTIQGIIDANKTPNKGLDGKPDGTFNLDKLLQDYAVSYTHLTLPTNREV